MFIDIISSKMNTFKTLCIMCIIVTVGNTIDIQEYGMRNNKTLVSRNTSTAWKATRKSVLVVNDNVSLRNGPEDQSVKSLVYMDYDDNGKKLNEFWMYNLQNVATFFEVFLDTRICHECSIILPLRPVVPGKYRFCLLNCHNPSEKAILL